MPLACRFDPDLGGVRVPQVAFNRRVGVFAASATAPVGGKSQRRPFWTLVTASGTC